FARSVTVVPVCSLLARSPPPLPTLSLHDALPISQAVTASGSTLRDWNFAPAGMMSASGSLFNPSGTVSRLDMAVALDGLKREPRSEEHTSELQSHLNLVCRLLLEKKKENTPPTSK